MSLKGIRTDFLIKHIKSKGTKFSTRIFSCRLLGSQELLVTVCISGKVCNSVKRNLMRRRIKEFIRTHCREKCSFFLRVYKFTEDKQELKSALEFLLRIAKKKTFPPCTT